MYEADQKTYDVGIDYQLSETETALLESLNIKTHQYDDLQALEKAYEKQDIAGYIEYKEEETSYYIYADESTTSGAILSHSLESYLTHYNEILAKEYIANQGVDVLAAYSQIDYHVVNLQQEGQNIYLNLIFTIAFTYIIMAIAMAAVNMATSTTAVEKENGTLETILTFPIKSSELIVGKYISTVIIGLVCSLFGFVLTVISLDCATKWFKAFQDINYSVSGNAIISSIIVILSAALFISGLAIALTCFAKTYKEAQSKSQILTSITLVPMFISILDITTSHLYYFIPVANYTTILMDIFSGRIDSFNLIIVLGSSICYVILIITYILRQYNSEKVLFTN
jgi:sodium transport system permease protein